MKIFRYLSLVVIATLVVSLLSIAPVSAAGPTGSWVSGIACQNPDPLNSVSVTFSFFQEGNSTAVLTYTDPIPAGGTIKYFTPNLSGLPTNFQGSAMVSSGQPVNCSVNTQSTGTGTTTSPFRAGTSSAFNDGSVGSTMYVPQITKAGTWNTYMAIQNASANPVTIQIHYYNRTDGVEVAAAMQTYTIQGNTNQVVYTSDNTNLIYPWYGSAKIIATNPVDTKLAVTVAFYNTATSYTDSQFQVYNAVNSGAHIIYASRVVRKYYGYNSGLAIQNIGNVDTTITLDFLFRDGSSFSYTSSIIKQGASLIVYVPNIVELNPVDALSMPNRTGTVKMTANATGAVIAGNVNMDNRGLATDNDGVPVPVENIGKGSSYNLSADGTATHSLVFPQVAKHFSSYTGGIVISNAEAVPGTCDITFVNQPGATITGRALPANGIISIYLGDVAALASGFNASVAATCTTNVFGTYNFSIEAGSGKYGDSYVENNALNQ